jgi:hypothetical protein
MTNKKLIKITLIKNLNFSKKKVSKTRNKFLKAPWIIFLNVHLSLQLNLVLIELLSTLVIGEELEICRVCQENEGKTKASYEILYA